MEDERGVEGVVILPSDGKKKLLIGTRMAATKERMSEHAEKEGQDEAFEKAADGLEVEGQTKELVRDSCFLRLVRLTMYHGHARIIRLVYAIWVFRMCYVMISSQS